MLELHPGQTGRKDAADSREAYGIEDFAQTFSIGRTIVFAEIKAGRLKAVKLGRRTLIPVTAAREWLAGLPAREVA